MRIVIQGKEIKVTLTADRELTTQEIISAHQLSTGNFEALFVEEESETQQPQSESAVATNDQSYQKDGWIEKGEWVEVEIMCPFCGHNGKTGTRWGNSFCKCPECSEKLYNKFATGTPGEKNSWGCVYVANEPMKFKNQLEEDQKMFAAIED